MATFCRRITRNVGKRVPTEDGRGFTTRPDGTESAYIELDVDVDRILSYLGEKAMRSKGNRSRALSGMIVAKATKRERTPPPPPISEEERNALRALNKSMNAAMRNFLK